MGLKNQSKKNQIFLINNILTSNVESLWEILTLPPCLATLTLLSLSQYGKVSIWHVPVKSLLLVNKWCSGYHTRPTSVRGVVGSNLAQANFLSNIYSVNMIIWGVQGQGFHFGCASLTWSLVGFQIGVIGSPTLSPWKKISRDTTFHTT